MAEPRGLEAMMPDRPRLLTVEEIDALVPLLSPTERQDLVGCQHDNPCECEPMYRSVVVRRALGPHYGSLIRMARAAAWLQNRRGGVGWSPMRGQWCAHTGPNSKSQNGSSLVEAIESAEEANRG
jgi:hypothetical protein